MELHGKHKRKKVDLHFKRAGQRGIAVGRRTARIPKYTYETGVFGIEIAPSTGRNHYQGRFELQSKRIGKRALLDILKETYTEKGWTVSPEYQTKESIDYCKKEGKFWYIGDSAPYTLPDLDIKLYPWQETMIGIARNKFHQETARLVWYLQDTEGGIGKAVSQSGSAVKKKICTGICYRTDL